MKYLFGGTSYTIFAVCTGMIGYTIHGSMFLSFVNFFFAPFAWLIWLINHDVNMTIIGQTFKFFFQ